MLNHTDRFAAAGESRIGECRMNVWKQLIAWMQNPQQRASACTVATVVILLLLPGIGWYLVYILWMINSIWSFRQTKDRTVKAVHAVIVAALGIWMLISLMH